MPAPNGEKFGEKNGITTTEVDRAVYSAVADEAVLEAGVELRLHTMLKAIRQIKSGWVVTLCGKEGLFDVSAKVVVDCSGDANAVSMAGLGVVRSEERQPGTLVLKLGGYDAKGIDYAAIQAAFDTHDRAI